MTEDELVAARQQITEAAGRGAAPMERAVAQAQQTPGHIDRILKLVKGSGDEHFDETGIAMIALRIIGTSYKKISEQLGVDVSEVRRVLAEARRLSKLSDVGPLLDNIALPQAVDNLIEKLEAGDLPATLATLRGRGAFRNFERSDNVDMQVQLSVVVEPPKGVDVANMPDVIQGSVVGVPRRAGQSTLVDQKNDDDEHQG